MCHNRVMGIHVAILEYAVQIPSTMQQGRARAQGRTHRVNETGDNVRRRHAEHT